MVGSSTFMALNCSTALPPMAMLRLPGSEKRLCELRNTVVRLDFPVDFTSISTVQVSPIFLSASSTVMGLLSAAPTRDGIPSATTSMMDRMLNLLGESHLSCNHSMNRVGNCHE